MLFNSFEFLLYFPIVTALFFFLPHRFRWQLLLAASCFFYMFFKPEYILILAFTIVVDYYAGILIEEAKTAKQKKYYLLISLIANIGVLAVFKYYNFINENITGVASLFGWKNHIPALTMLLPIGLSFHTFQAMSYTLEISRGNYKAERHFGIYALYVMFYPQLVAGPIERPQNVLHQFHEKKSFDYSRVVDGLRMMLWGMFKKIVIADNLTTYTDGVYNNLHVQTSIAIVVAIFFFAFQIYCDFSAYTDIARGAARVMGYELVKNFNYPFRSRNVTDFWRRWHMSLTTWFNDYLFTPVVISNRGSIKFGIVFALMVTFSLSGLWHGAAWTYVGFGVMHGFATSYEFLTKKWRNRLSKKVNPFIYSRVSQVLTFLFVCYTWIFFRANTMADAFYVLKRIPGFFTEIANWSVTRTKPIFDGSLPKLGLIYCGVFILLLETLHYLDNKYDVFNKLRNQNIVLRWSVYYSLMIIMIFFASSTAHRFIYFQF
ncbi:MBOAT family protein [Mucilaginibacter gynuensis]|uniref:MBOAT family protein n=1 Tax=Mucilaginibacter gynuensis TaxID=1302236 RepID=A0ABP8G855_9SPHI